MKDVSHYPAEPCFEIFGREGLRIDPNSSYPAYFVEHIPPIAAAFRAVFAIIAAIADYPCRVLSVLVRFEQSLIMLGDTT